MLKPPRCHMINRRGGRQPAPTQPAWTARGFGRHGLSPCQEKPVEVLSLGTCRWVSESSWWWLQLLKMQLVPVGACQTALGAGRGRGTWGQQPSRINT